MGKNPAHRELKASRLELIKEEARKMITRGKERKVYVPQRYTFQEIEFLQKEDYEGVVYVKIHGSIKGRAI